jgi:type 1 fimbriae regulatory protein FimB/type 1 fimbriae regulatory protein FimE
MIETTLERSAKHANRNALLILLTYRHGLRVSEATRLRWSQICLDSKTIRVERTNGGVSSTQPLSAGESERLRDWKNARFGHGFFAVPYDPEALLFERSRGKPLSPRTISHIVATAGITAGLGLPVHPHMLRHACGYFVAHHLADPVAVQQYLGLKSIQNAMRYFRPKTVEFRNIWKE